MERISALMDGELEQREAIDLIPVLRRRDDIREAWATYHLIGEAMRGHTCSYCGVARAVTSRLAAEPAILAPRASGAMIRIRRWALPGMAVAAAVGSMTWMSLQTMQPRTDAQPIAFTEVRPADAEHPTTAFNELVAPAGTNVTTPTIRLTSDEYQPYVMAHQPFSPSVAIQGLAPYMRAVGAGSDER